MFLSCSSFVLAFHFWSIILFVSVLHVFVMSVLVCHFGCSSFLPDFVCMCNGWMDGWMECYVMLCCVAFCYVIVS